jgi:hypothetical protein
MEVSGQFHTPAALSMEKQPPVSIGQEAGQAPEPGGYYGGKKNLARDGIWTLVIQSIAHCYTNSAVPAANEFL